VIAGTADTWTSEMEWQSCELEVAIQTERANYQRWNGSGRKMEFSEL